VRVTSLQEALIRIFWVWGSRERYGEARPILVEGRRGAEVFVHPDISKLGPEIAAAGQRDRLLRETIVYLTCVHETGHALGLSHTATFNDIMYSFAYGGDIREYFSRHRRKLTSRQDLRKLLPISPADRKQLLRALEP
jgi:hypothetical protein